VQTASAHTVERLEAALALAERLGYRVRLESLWSEGGGGCEIRGQKWLFVDLSLAPREQLEQVLATLRREAALHAAARPPRESAAESPQPPTGEHVSDAAPKTARGFLPRWRRWYKMMIGR
jgi:hypothetical protein